MRALATLLLFLFAAAASASAAAQVGALQTDCGLGGARSDGSTQFVATCAGRARSPDGRFAIVQRAYRETQSPIELHDARGRRLATIPAISDDMPFLVAWAPNSRWFFVNHHVGSFMDTLRVFEIVGQRAVERPALARSAVRIAARRYPCLRPQLVNPSGVQWMPDGRRIVLVTLSAPYACSEFGLGPGDWRPLWMIGDVRTGLVESRSIRVQPDGRPFQMPSGAPYPRR